MPWARLDDNFHDHPKVLPLSLSAVGLYTLCLTWAHRNTRSTPNPGLIPSSLPSRFAGTDSESPSGELVTCGLWDIAENGWLIHDFADYLPTEKTREQRSKAGSKGAAKRWHADGNLPSSSHDVASGLPEESIAKDGSRADARWVSHTHTQTHTQEQPPTSATPTRRRPR